MASNKTWLFQYYDNQGQAKGGFNVNRRELGTEKVWGAPGEKAKAPTNLTSHGVKVPQSSPYKGDPFLGSLLGWLQLHGLCSPRNQAQFTMRGATEWPPPPHSHGHALLSLSLAVLPAICPVWSNRLRPQSRTLWPTATSVDKRRRFLPAHLMASPFPPLAEVSMAFRPSSACADTPYSRTQGKRRCRSQQTHVSLGGQAPWPGYLSILRHSALWQVTRFNKRLMVDGWTRWVNKRTNFVNYKSLY